jgi:hypothetical protein
VGRRYLERCGLRYENNINIDLREYSVVCIDQAEDRDQLQGVADMVTALWSCKGVGVF